MTDEGYADDLTFLANIQAQAESLQYGLEQSARGTDLNVNANKIEYMCFKPEGVISNLRSELLKLLDQFTFLGRNISSTESDFERRCGIILTS